MEKVLMEEQLQETAGELVAAERELADLQNLNLRTAPAALHSPDSSKGQPAPGASPRPSGSNDEVGGGGSAAELAALRAENDAIMRVRGRCLWAGCALCRWTVSPWGAASQHHGNAFNFGKKSKHAHALQLVRPGCMHSKQTLERTRCRK